MDIQDTKKYIDAVEDYLDTDINYCANTIIYADEDDLRQLAQDSFHAGVKWCESQKVETSKGALNLASIKGSGFKDEMSRAFAAGRVMQRCNKLTYWDDDEMKDVEYSGFNAWFKHHYL